MGSPSERSSGLLGWSSSTGTLMSWKSSLRSVKLSHSRQRVRSTSRPWNSFSIKPRASRTNNKVLSNHAAIYINHFSPFIELESYRFHFSFRLNTLSPNPPCSVVYSPVSFGFSYLDVSLFSLQQKFQKQIGERSSPLALLMARFPALI